MFISDIAEVQCQSPMTVDAHVRLMRLFLRVTPGITSETNIQDVTEDVLLLFVHRGVRDRKWGPGTVDTHQRRLHTFFAWLVRRGIVAINPVSGMTKPRLPKAMPKSLKVNQAQMLLEAAPLVAGESAYVRARAKALMATFLFAGLRKSEVLNLAVEDVDLTNRIITVIAGKGAKDRHVPMTESLTLALQAYATERIRALKLCPFFFTSEHHDSSLADMTLRRLTDRVQVHVGFHFSVHMLRHTFATLMIEGGCDVYALAEMMGHSDIRTTTIYLSNSVEHLRNQIGMHPLLGDTIQPSQKGTIPGATRWRHRPRFAVDRPR